MCAGYGFLWPCFSYDGDLLVINYSLYIDSGNQLNTSHQKKGKKSNSKDFIVSALNGF